MIVAMDAIDILRSMQPHKRLPIQLEMLQFLCTPLSQVHDKWGERLETLPATLSATICEGAAHIHVHSECKIACLVELHGQIERLLEVLKKTYEGQFIANYFQTHFDDLLRTLRQCARRIAKQYPLDKSAA